MKSLYYTSAKLYFVMRLGCANEYTHAKHVGCEETSICEIMGESIYNQSISQSVEHIKIYCVAFTIASKSYWRTYQNLTVS